MNNLSSELAFLKKQNSLKPASRPEPLISDYIEGLRVLPPSTPFPGAWQNRRTPYAVEIMNNMSPFSPVIYSDVMKGAQLGVTAAAENIVAYWMDEQPAEILYVSSTEGLLLKWATKRLDPLIDSCGFRHKIHAQSDASAKTRRSGDRTFSKEFVGGALDMASAQSASSLRSDSKRILIMDEVDGAPRLLKTGEGAWTEVAEGRTNAWGSRKKILAISTPGLMDSSLINERFLEGDQRLYMVPCPHCGKFQPLELGSNDSKHGLKPDKEKGRTINVFYICDFCGDACFNHHKGKMLIDGRWEPTAESSSKFRRSYQISSLYSPVGMMSWLEFYERYEKALEIPDGMRSFTNLYLGMPYRETGQRPKLQNVIELKGAYASKHVPDDVIFITIGVDVQRGSANNPDNPARIEMEVLGTGMGYRTWSIAYLTFEGAIDDPSAGAWAAFQEFAENDGLSFKKSDGSSMSPSLIFIDSGDGMHADTVYRFCSGWQSTFPSKGFQALKKRKHESGDELSTSNFKRFRAQKVGNDVTLYEISTNFYKNVLYKNLKVQRNDQGAQPPGFCDFPIDYEEKYFKGLTAEEKRTDGSFFCATGVRNEPLDCRVYAMCAADVFIDSKIADIRAAMKQNGATPMQLQQVNSLFVLRALQGS